MTMREILFRGKEIGIDRWVHGSLDIHKSGVVVIMTDEIVTSIYARVAPETVGQYTGLTDKNGTKIFEGDILSTHFDFNNPDVESRTVVEWGNFRWVTHQPGYDPDDITDFDEGLWTVIGNIHDNPELMEGK